jgi:chromosome partitioning protein
MRLLAVYSIKGGVGKTSTAVNLAYASARQLRRTLLWDLDPQGASTYYFRVKPKVKGGVSRLFGRRRRIERSIKGTDFPYLDLLPTDASNRYADLILDALKRPRRGLHKAVRELRKDYDVVLLDCPPSISLLSENVIRAATALVVPIIPTTLSLRTLEQLTELCHPRLTEGLDILPFFSMVDRRKKLHREIVETLPAERPDLLTTQIPYASLVEQMGLHRAPLAAYAAGSPEAARYAALWDEIRQRVGL